VYLPIDIDMRNCENNTKQTNDIVFCVNTKGVNDNNNIQIMKINANDIFYIWISIKRVTISQKI
jgi:hypothetical protein